MITKGHSSKQRRSRKNQYSSQERHSRHRASEWGLYCAWGRNAPATDADSAAGLGAWVRCNQLVKLEDCDRHLRVDHDAARDDRCKMLDKSGNICNKPCSGKYKRHSLSGKRHAGPLEGSRILQAGCIFGKKEALPTMECKYCGEPYSIYVGGNGTSLARHVASKHPEHLL